MLKFIMVIVLFMILAIIGHLLGVALKVTSEGPIEIYNWYYVLVGIGVTLFLLKFGRVYQWVME